MSDPEAGPEHMARVCGSCSYSNGGDDVCVRSGEARKPRSCCIRRKFSKACARPAPTPSRGSLRSAFRNEADRFAVYGS